MSFHLGFDDAQQTIADSLAQFCAERCPEDSVRGEHAGFSRDLWRELGELGVLALTSPEGDGGAQELVAALESLGAALFPGPIAASLFAAAVLPEALRKRVVEGRAIVSLGVPPLMPFAPVADLFLALDDDAVFLAEPRGEIVPVTTLGGEPWGRIELARRDDLGPVARAHAVHDVARAAYLAAAGRALVASTAAHARTRKQFGRPIGDFQAVAHPLADCALQLDTACALARRAAHAFDLDPDAARSLAVGARLSAGHAALEAVYVCHQLYGAQGVTLEGPVFVFSRRIRQLVSEPPSEDRARESLLAGFGLVGEDTLTSSRDPRSGSRC